MALPDLEILAAKNGLPTLRAGDEWLDDAIDPEEGARVFADSVNVRGKDAVVLFGHGLGYRVAALSEKGIPRLFVFEPDEELTAWVRAERPGALAGVTVVHDLEALTSLLAGDDAGRPYETTLVAHAGYRRAYPEVHAELVTAINSGRSRAMARLNTLRERIPPIIEGGVSRLGRTRGAVAARTLEGSLAGETVFVVSAGPSLDRNVHLLGEAARKGVILTNSTALPALRARGVPVDVLAVIDPLARPAADAQAYANVRAIALDLGADAGLHAMDLPRAVFVQAGMLGALATDVTPMELSYGASVATACVALAELWGAAHVVLVGQDCAYTGGRFYASGLGRDDFRVEADPRILRFHYPEQLVAQFLAHSGTQLPTNSMRIDVPAWGGEGTVYTSADLDLFRDWFVTQARTKPGLRRTNATEGGAEITGWAARSLAEVLGELPERRVDLSERLRTAPRVDTDGLLALRHRQAGRLRVAIRACRTLLTRAGGVATRERAIAEVRGIVREVGALEVHARGRILERNAFGGGRAAEQDILRTLLHSAERLLPLFAAED